MKTENREYWYTTIKEFFIDEYQIKARYDEQQNQSKQN